MLTRSRQTPPKKQRHYNTWQPTYFIEDEATCLVQSPDGRHECRLADGHPEFEHRAFCIVMRWVQLTESDAKQVGGTAGDWITTNVVPNQEQQTIVALWPRRDDDRQRSGEVTDRKAEWRIRHGDHEAAPEAPRRRRRSAGT